LKETEDENKVVDFESVRKGLMEKKLKERSPTGSSKDSENSKSENAKFRERAGIQRY
jgi:hypothetical protein